MSGTKNSQGLTIAQTAAAMGWHTDDVRRGIRNEQIPVIRCGESRRKLRVPADWVADPKGWLTRNFGADQ